ncbi:alkaline phosphatase family protein [Caloramator sp. ALD01]|uniref:alkaline phosphatase family protein n=1 Tax=Caloramator sp. ALD01 TaxID=1031288 RepID=UPI000423AFA2|nr:alkaline phosphatase family protein [Caloramator sp. ALD01]
MPQYIKLTLLLYILILNSTISLFKFTFYDITTNSKPTNKKVCLIIVDGLRLDAINNMPFIQNLIKNNDAKFAISVSDKPTISRAGYMRILTGAPTDISGISSNNQHIPSPVLSISDLAIKHNLKTALCGYFWIDELFPFSFHYKKTYFIRDGTTFIDAVSIVNSFKPDFLIVHPMSVDNAGHSFGGSSMQYKNTASKIDLEIYKLYKQLSKYNYDIIITSDHGHQDFGGHTKYEENTFLTPFVFISKNTNIKLTKSINQIDIAPTLCDLLGIPKTLYMTGNSLLDNQNITTIRNAHILNPNLPFEYNLNFSLFITNILLTIHLIIYFYFIRILLAKF